MRKYYDLDEGYDTFAWKWQEFNRNGRIVTKTKEFETLSAMNKFIEKTFEKDNFYQSIATSYPKGHKFEENEEYERGYKDGLKDVLGELNEDSFEDKFDSLVKKI